MESAASWKQYWKVLDTLQDPANVPDLRLFNNILHPAGSRNGKDTGDNTSKGKGSSVTGALHQFQSKKTVPDNGHYNNHYIVNLHQHGQQRPLSGGNFGLKQSGCRLPKPKELERLTANKMKQNQNSGDVQEALAQNDSDERWQGSSKEEVTALFQNHRQTKTPLNLDSPASRHATQHPENSLGSWGSRHSLLLQEQVDKLAGKFMLPKSRSQHGAVSGSSQSSEERMEGIVRALDLLSEFANGTVVKSKTKNELEQAEEILQQVAEEQHEGGGGRHDPVADLLRPLPSQPLEFPASSAWDYLISSQCRFSGAQELELTIEDLRHKVKIFIEKAGMDKGLSSPALEQIDRELGLEELAQMRSVPNHQEATQQSEFCLDSRGTLDASEKDSYGDCATSRSEREKHRLPEIQYGAHPKRGAETEKLWEWFEHLMVNSHTAESTRLEVLNHREQLTEQCPHAFNPHNSGGPQIQRAVDRLTNMASTIKHQSGQSVKDAVDQETLAHLRLNTLRAAATSSLDPTKTRGLVYFLIKSVTSLDKGTIGSSDASFLILSCLELLLGELHWLLSLLHLNQGLASPHLQALHAVLKAYEKQSELASKLHDRADSLQQSIMQTIERANAADRNARAAMLQQDELEQKNDRLQRRNGDLERELQKLRARVAFLEGEAKHRVSLSGIL